MGIHYDALSVENVHLVKDLCNDLMMYQKSKALIHPEFFDGMSFETSSTSKAPYERSCQRS